MEFVNSTFRACHLAMCVGKDCLFFSEFLIFPLAFCIYISLSWLEVDQNDFHYSWFVAFPQFGIMFTDITSSRSNIMYSVGVFSEFI